MRRELVNEDVQTRQLRKDGLFDAHYTDSANDGMREGENGFVSDSKISIFFGSPLPSVIFDMTRAKVHLAQLTPQTSSIHHRSSSLRSDLLHPLQIRLLSPRCDLLIAATTTAAAACSASNQRFVQLVQHLHHQQEDVGYVLGNVDRDFFELLRLARDAHRVRLVERDQVQ